jgi:hypothetical protein
MYQPCYCGALDCPSCTLLPRVRAPRRFPLGSRSAEDIDRLWDAHRRCDICQARPASTRGVWHDVVRCAACAAGEPTPADEA